MTSQEIAWPPVADDLANHWEWRPEWAPDRPCLYWYLTFAAHELTTAIGSEALEAVQGVPWLDPVPPEWMHVTLADVGFVDDLEERDVHRTVENVRQHVEGRPALDLSLGPVAAMPGAVVLQVGPTEPLVHLQGAVGAATQAALGPGHEPVHRDDFWPHLSLGYVNRGVASREADAALRRVGWVSGRVSVSRLTLASVTRRDRHYQWTVVAQLPLLGRRRTASVGG